MVIMSHLPPSRAGIGKTFMQAREMEITAIKRKSMVGPEWIRFGKYPPMMPTMPETPSVASEIWFFPCRLILLSGLRKSFEFYL